MAALSAAQFEDLLRAYEGYGALVQAGGGAAAAGFAARELIEIFIRKSETSHKFRKFLAFSEFFRFFLALFLKIFRTFVISWNFS